MVLNNLISNKIDSKSPLETADFFHSIALEAFWWMLSP